MYRKGLWVFGLSFVLWAASAGPMRAQCPQDFKCDAYVNSLGIGTLPLTSLHILGGNWNPNDTEGDFRLGDDTYKFKIGIARGGGGAGDVRLRAQGGANRLWLGSGFTDTLVIQGQGNVGIGLPNYDSLFGARLDVNGADGVAGRFINSGPSGTSTMALFARNTSPAAGVAVLGEAFGYDATAVFTAFGSGDILRGFHGGSLVFRILNDGGFIASGPKSALVTTASYGNRQLYAMESPENWFEDFGKAQLTNGQAVVRLDPIFAETVNTESDYHIFLTPKGDCKGLYVARQTATTFDVRELQNGASTVAFDYRIVAKRKNYETVRLAKIAEEKPTTQVAKVGR